MTTLYGLRKLEIGGNIVDVALDRQYRACRVKYRDHKVKRMETEGSMW